MEKSKPNYYAILPAEIRYDKRLSPAAKILFAEITALTNNHRICWSTNKYFEELYQVSKQTINNWLLQLEECGYIERFIYRADGSKEILHRYITIFSHPSKINLNRPIQEILNDNNTSINNTSNNYLKKKNSKRKFINANPRKK
ncbi:helix-turn-helix domain-containing protein [Aquimarina agarilytica]|uniref:helix-turn-helix domain-containing protein n=1 Tax=Aquimarina agarilytica TaxID=1087449 RepID=UPI0002895105|nr:helix-turn-helix domain-containing protein [Aquimarina agarilytica]